MDKYLKNKQGVKHTKRINSRTHQKRFWDLEMQTLATFWGCKVMTERKTSLQSLLKVDYLPDVGIVCWNVILASGIKIIFWAIHWRLDSLVLSPQLPPLGVVVFFSNIAPLKTFQRHWSIRKPYGRNATFISAIFIKAFISDSKGTNSKPVWNCHFF